MFHSHDFTKVSPKASGHIIPEGTVYREGEHLFRMGDKLDTIFMVNSGVVKLFTISESGEEHIVRFCMPGDLLGLEVLTDGVSKTNAHVLDIANITALPFSAIMMNKDAYDLGALMERIATALSQENEHCMIISQATASRKVAWFLCDFADKLAKRGLIADIFDMPMTRSEIGLYLGLAVETVSRELAKFSKKGLINKHLKHIEIADMDALRAIATASSALH
jgi:CRP/FNR family transcriptional regulator